MPGAANTLHLKATKVQDAMKAAWQGPKDGCFSVVPASVDKAVASVPAGKPSSRQARVSMPAPSITTCLGLASAPGLNLPLNASVTLRSNHQVRTASRPACAPAHVAVMAWRRAPHPVTLSAEELGDYTILLIDCKVYPDGE